ncbi:MAG: PD40 domain-containing protein [Cytophagia bacterium]|nr:PD40 domain-containing protein [Cytophagia bacterium]
MKKRFLFLFLLFLSFHHLSAQHDPILFTLQEKGGNDELALLTSSGVKKLTNHPAKDSSPNQSSDGRYIVFTSERNGWWKIWLYDLEADKISQLTNSATAEYAPCFSPNGKEIVFTSGRTGNADLFIMNVDGSEMRNLTESAETESNAHWATDGFIYYSSNASGKYQITRIKPDGTGKEVLSDGTSDDLNPRLSPDNKTLVFYSYRYDNPEICIMKLSDRNVVRLTDNPLQDIRPAWSSDGSQIVFERGNKRNDQQIYLMNADGSNQRALTTEGYNYSPVFATKLNYLNQL